jgi:hypothetical protein
MAVTASTVKFLILIAFLLPGGAAFAQESKVVFWRLKALGIEAETASRINAVLRSEIGRVPGCRLVPAEKVTSVVSKHEDLSGCPGEVECLSQMGMLTGADLVVSGVLGTLGDVFSLDIKLVDVASKQEIRRVAQTWSGEEKFLIEVMRQVATRLLKPEAYSGRLELNVSVPGVEIFIDGDPAGRTPLEAPLRLSPGRHALKLVCSGFKDYQRFVEVPFNRTVPLFVEMKGSRLTGVVSAEESQDLIAIGLKGGLVTNLDAFLGPQVYLEAGLRLPVWGGRLGVMLETGAYGCLQERSLSDPALGRIDLSADVLVWPIQLNLMLRLTPSYPFSPYLGVGGGFFLVWQTLKAERLPERSFRDGVFGFQAFGGLEYRLGPGVVLLEGRYQCVHLDAPDEEGGMEGLLGGLGVLLGYRVLLQ